MEDELFLRNPHRIRRVEDHQHVGAGIVPRILCNGGGGERRIALRAASLSLAAVITHKTGAVILISTPSAPRAAISGWLPTAHILRGTNPRLA